ncbi:ATP-binding protein [Catenulispora subtropica]|uniref:LuxR family transcriptional regulator n=1 Tax=Catenulispora subtropica TaxID=450798 RepID=A0ABP5CQ89_9ACTN
MSDAPGHDGTRHDGGFVFVGRRHELTDIVSALMNPPAIVLVEGEAGIGKSRLAYEAGMALTSEGCHVVTGFCHPLREPVPFGPVVDALSKAGELLPPRDKIPRTAGALASLLPDIADQLPVPPPATDDAGQERDRRMRGVRSLLAAIGPVTVVIEDVHWADEVTRELLLLLSRDMPETLSLVLTFRAGDLPPGSPLLGSAFRRQPGTRALVVHLAPLTEQDVWELTQDALGASADATVGRTLYERSAGVPLVAEEDLITLLEKTRRAAAAETADLAADLERAELPHGLRESLTERFAALSPAGQAVVEAAAVLAVPATEVLLAQVADLPDEDEAQGLTEALDSAVLVEDSPAHYAFRHVLAQQVVYQQIPGPRRTRLHRRAVAVLESLPSPPLVQVAHHALALGDKEAWLERAEAAANKAVALGDAGTAATLFHQILDQRDLAPEVRSRVAIALALIAANGVDYIADAALLRRLLADPQLPTATRGEIRLALGLLITNHGGDRAGFLEIEHAAEELAERPERAARAMIALALDEQDGAWSRAWEWMHRADAALRRSPNAAMLATAEATRLTLMAREGDPAVWSMLERLPRHPDDVDILRQTARALYNVGDIAVEVGHDRRAEALLTESRVLAHRANIPYLVSYNRIVLARLEGLRGNWEKVEKRFNALAYEYPDIAMLHMEQAMLLGLIADARGHRRQAVKQFALAARLGRTESQVTMNLRAASALAATGLSEGTLGEAWSIVEPAVATLRGAAAWARGTGLVPTAVETALARGDRAFAERLADDAEEGLQHRDAPAATAELHVARGLLHGASEQAVHHFDLARRLWADIGRPYSHAQAVERMGVALAELDPGQGYARLDEAMTGFTKLGAAYDAARCQSTLRSLGLFRHAPRGRHGYGSQLSPRERQVAELLAQGATNRDIAQALFLSPRTVETHVANVLRKLDTSRKDVGEVLAAAKSQA